MYRTQIVNEVVKINTHVKIFQEISVGSVLQLLSIPTSSQVGLDRSYIGRKLDFYKMQIHICSQIDFFSYFSYTFFQVFFSSFLDLKRFSKV